MQRIIYRIKSLSPIVISSKAGDMNMVTTEKYIPASSVIGVLAKRFMTMKNISDKAHEDESFYNWFLVGKLKISNACILPSNDEAVYLPVPVSIQKKKGEDRVIYDLLHVDEDFDEHTESVNKFCMLEDDILITKEVETGLNFHHAKDREKGVSEEGIIFNYESVSPNQIFQGEISGNEKDLHELIKICGKKWIAHVGRSKNAQYGKAEIEIIDEPSKPLQAEKEWNDEISLTLLSDTIIYNDNGFSVVDIDVFKKYLGNVKVKRAFIKKRDVEGFISVWKLRKPSESCFLAGSSFLLDISESDKEKLAEFEKTGIGERTHEGFGRCILGWQTEKNPVEHKKEDRPESKESELPEKAKQILKTIAENYMKKQAELMGLKEQKYFRKETLPANSLIGRLSAILKKTGKQTEFVKALNSLKRKAKNSLEDCENKRDKINLSEFLEGFTLTEKSFSDLKSEIPQEVMNNLKSLTGKKYIFIKELEKVINDADKAVTKEKLNEYIDFVLQRAEFHINVIDKILKENRNDNLTKICNKIGYHPEKDKEIENELCHIYLTTFFSMMRKREKKED